jgi:F420-0:gamma-glutamyl ligase
MIVNAIKTRVLLPPQDNLLEVIDETVLDIPERSVLAISSKAVAVWQGRTVKIPEDAVKARSLKESLIKTEADYFLEKDTQFPYSSIFTIYEGVFGSSSGIDESNSNGYFTLLPRDVNKTAEQIRACIIEKYGITDCGVVIVDSKSQPMRNGVVGVAVGYAGFAPLYDYRGKTDLFGRTLKYERINVADCLATTATFAMGEGSECTPLVLMSDIPHITFTNTRTKDPFLRPNVSRAGDAYAQFISTHNWKKGGAQHNA